MTHLKKISLGVSLMAITLLGAGCYGAATNTNTSGTGSAVSMEDNGYSPTNLTVAKGTTVTWTNNDAVNHTVTGTSGGPDSVELTSGQTYSYTFSDVGTFPYYCKVHGTGMAGRVTVTE